MITEALFIKQLKPCLNIQSDLSKQVKVFLKKMEIIYGVTVRKPIKGIAIFIKYSF